METHQSTTDQSATGESSGRAFYLPATVQLSDASGRVERVLAARLPRRTAEPPADAGTRRVPGFYLPATFQLAEPGRVGRAVAALRRRGAAVRSAVRSRVR